MHRIFLLAALVACAYATPVLRTTPVFPTSYFFEGVFSIPDYDIFEELAVHTDESLDMQRISYYGGRDVYLTRGDKGMVYEVVPRIDRVVCFSSNVSGPTSNNANVPLAPFLPDLSTWQFAGEETIRNVDCEVWQHEVKNDTKTATYRFAVAKSDNTPVQLHMHGLNYIQGSHPDLYILDFHVFVPSVNATKDFEIPEQCNVEEAAAPPSARVGARVRAVVERLGRVAPPRSSSKCGESPDFLAFVAQHGKTYTSCEEAARREQVWRSNMLMIATTNAKNAALGEHVFQLKPNKFADMTDDEFRLLMLQQRGGRPQDNRATRTHVRNANDVLPPSKDWRKEGAVTPIKDQGICGSCYAFGSVASLEGVNYNKHNRLVRVSEQQTVDCSWGYQWAGPGGNLACDGGYASAVYQWMMDNGGVALESSYKYTMQDGWCSAKDHSAGIRVTGYVNVTSSVDDLKHAVATVGPVAVAIDASHPSLRFYASGVYYEPECKSDMNSLDHEVAAVGYGVENGQEYWIIKNSWSEIWGDEGYVKMSMKDNNCGVATQANYPIVA